MGYLSSNLEVMRNAYQKIPFLKSNEYMEEIILWWFIRHDAKSILLMLFLTELKEYLLISYSRHPALCLEKLLIFIQFNCAISSKLKAMGVAFNNNL